MPDSRNVVRQMTEVSGKTMKVLKFGFTILILGLILSCASSDHVVGHKSETAFVSWWTEPHYDQAYFYPFENWELLSENDQTNLSANSNLPGITYRVHSRDEQSIWIVVGTDHIKCDEQKVWLLAQPQNSYLELSKELSYELCSGGDKYSDITEAILVCYYASDSTYPIVEISTNGPACTSSYLYVWDKQNSGYKFIAKNCS